MKSIVKAIFTKKEYITASSMAPTPEAQKELGRFLEDVSREAIGIVNCDGCGPFPLSPRRKGFFADSLKIFA